MAQSLPPKMDKDEAVCTSLTPYAAPKLVVLDTKSTAGDAGDTPAIEDNLGHINDALGS